MKKKLKKTTDPSPQVKQMYRLMALYATLIDEPGAWTIPWVWQVFYISGLENREESYVAWTNNIIFAAMIFEAAKLPEVVKVIGINIVSVDKDFENIVLNTKK